MAALAVPATPALAGDGDDPDELVVITGGAEVRSSETVEDVFVVDGDVSVDGFVDGDVVAVAGDVNVTGDISGDLTAFAGQITVERGASVGGDVTYGDEEPEIERGAEIGGDVTDEDLDDFSDAPWGLIASIALWIAMTASLLVLGLMLVAMTPRVAEATAAAGRSNLWESLGIGIAAWIGLPLLGALALITVIGIPMGVILLLATIPVFALGYIAASHALGRRVAGSASPVLAFLAGFGILRAIALIPFLGAAVSALAATWGVGMLIVAASRAGAGGRATAAAAPRARKPAAKPKKKPAAKKPAATKKRAAKKKPPAR